MADQKGQEGHANGAERAAILLMSLGEQEAAQVLQHMGPKEVHKVSMAIASLNNIDKERVNGVLADFCNTVDTQTALGVGAQDYMRNVLVKALGEEKAGNILDRVVMGSSASGLEQLKWMDPRAIAEVIRMEHPQIMSVVLSYLDSDVASEVMALLPERTRVEILLRIASLDTIHPSALQELNEIMEKQFTGSSNVQSATVGGIKTAANILNLMDASAETSIIEQIKEIDAELGEKMEDLMFVFDDLAEVDDRGLQALLREVSSDTLVLALKGSDEAVKEKIFKNMSKRAAEMLRDDLEAKGPVKLSEVEAAQKEILAIARRMAESGDLVLGGKGAEEYV